MDRGEWPLGTILAGGAGRRIGGAKAMVMLHGKPLICYPLRAVSRALGEVVVLAKADNQLPSMPGVTVWVEPGVVRHPLVGIVHALDVAAGQPVLVCGADLPFVTEELILRLAQGSATAPALLAAHGSELQPLLGWYHPRALAPLRELSTQSGVLRRDGGVGQAGIPLREAVARLDPASLEVHDARLLFNVNSPDDLLQAAGMMDRRQGCRGA